jgi:hypothetical protein
VGDIVGYYIDSNRAYHGFLLSNGVYTNIDDPQSSGLTVAKGINDAGLITGYYLGQGSHGFLALPPPNSPPPPGTTADLFLNNNDGVYEIYNIGGNSILAAYR